jgi:uncharacterized protein YkwD
MSKVHDLINYERKKRGIPTVYWSREMARLAQSQANYCAKVGRLVHSNRFAFQGGENLAEGGRNFSPRAIVDCWLNSKAGHREYLLSPKAKKAGVGIAKSRGKTFAAWAFSEEPPSYPDCPYYKAPRPKTQKPKKVGVPLRMKLQRTHKLSQIQKVVTRLFLNLLVLAGLGFLIRHSYLLFTQPTAPLKNSIILIIGIALWILLIRLLRKKYGRTNPSFKLTTFSVIAISLVFAFVGIQPISMYKDNLVNTLSDKWKSYREAQEVLQAEKVAEAIAMTPMLIKEAPSKTETTSGPTVTQTLKVEEAEREAFELINAVREEAGIPPTKWDDELYKLSKKHTQEMADRGELFHTPLGAEHGENAWGGKGYYHYRYEELAKVIVGSWMSSPLHKAWLLHAPIKESVVSIVVTPNGQYASWSFWTRNLGRGPELVEKVAREWRNSGSGLDWIPWLISKGYLKP